MTKHYKKGIKMIKTSVIAVVVCALALTFSTVAFSQPAGMNGKMGQGMGMGGHMMMKKGMGGGFPMLMAKLKLTPEQKEKIGGLRIAFQKSMIDLKANLAKDKLGLKELRLKDDINRNDVLDVVSRINKDRDAISLAVANHIMDVYSVLSPDQRKIAKETIFKFRAKMHMMHRGQEHKWMMN